MYFHLGIPLFIQYLGLDDHVVKIVITRNSDNHASIVLEKKYGNIESEESLQSIENKEWDKILDLPKRTNASYTIQIQSVNLFSLLGFKVLYINRNLT